MGQVLAVTHIKRHIIRVFPAAAIFLALGFVSGCDQLGQRAGLTGQIDQVSPAPISPDRLRVTLPEIGAQATLAPVANQKSATVWQTLDGITLTFSEGILMETRGLGEDLMSSDATGTLTMFQGGLESEYYPVIRSYLDGEDETVFVAYQCRKTQDMEQRINIEDKFIYARRLKERCVAPDHRFTNIYWLDNTRSVIRSRQWVSHTIGHMVTERVMR